MQRCHYNASLPLLLSVDLPQYVIDLKYTYTGDIAEFIQKEAPLPPLLIAHSFGGLIVQQYISYLQGAFYNKASPASMSHEDRENMKHNDEAHHLHNTVNLLKCNAGQQPQCEGLVPHNMT
ncbi:hypothetical protein PVAP13_7NG019500 [Panicum virgatum]|uniref:Uncharacterized protein n=1 Tax=Panicum virgatum TaxID=38727 RepID=A0A8T0PRQ4_PANVG|nr:hypothetical protein PVAP13_7NG019500 [Panicum virgatum]KAG2565037.1 hypothetical protein PVAP13_7NG019500 [Panicum virgatum]